MCKKTVKSSVLVKKSFKVSTLMIAIFMSHHVMANTVQESSGQLPVIEVTAEEDNRYEQGKDKQFTENIVNIYKDKEEVERFKGVNPADLLSGMPGVYSSDARNNGAISPNVRGLQGEGRVPVMVDGTRSEYTVYRGYTGVNNRTYVDPNLISEVKAYKGATELGYGMPQATGGAVILNTMDSHDVIPEDKNWGVSVKYETNNNSTAPRYPKINYGERVDTPENHWTLFGDANPNLYIPLKNNGKNKFFDDYAFRFAVAGKNDLTDLMLAYSKREQGNYFSGSKKADMYTKRFDDEYTNKGKDIKFADFALPGYETPNTSSKNESWLLKNNWYLPNNQEVNISFRHSNLEYGEIMNSRSVYSSIISQVFDYGPDSNIGVQWTPAKVQQHAGRIDYKFNPDENKWLNLKSGLWYSNTHSRNNSSGGSIADVAFIDGNIDMAMSEMLLNSSCIETTNGVPSLYGTNKFDVSCKLTEADLARFRQAYKDKTGYDIPKANEYLKVTNPALHIVRTNHFGVDISNEMQLLPNLSLTVGANLHKEKRIGHQPESTKDCGGRGFDADGNCQGLIVTRGYIFPPKSGERDEYATWLNLNWQATDKLNIKLGGRWGAYSLEDKETDQRMMNKELERKQVRDRIEYQVYQLITDEEKQYLYDNKIWCGRTTWCRDRPLSEVLNDYNAFLAQRGYERRQRAYWVLKERAIWQADDQGRLHAHNAPFSQLKDGQHLQGNAYYKKQSEEEKYQPLGKQKNRAFDPSLSVSYQFTPYTRAYARYTQMTRFPSIYEGVSGFSDLYHKVVEPRNFKPEQARNVEIGVVQDFTQWLPQFKVADLKLNYYHNKTHNVIDRSDYLNGNFFAQYDELKTKGIELQTRIDQGRIFADLGYSYLLESQMCDTSYAYETYFQNAYPLGKDKNITTNDISTCFTGGFPGGYLRGAIPPKHSVAFNIGSRWLDERLTLGSRISYQSAANNKRQNTEKWNRAEGLNSYPWRSYTTIDAYADYKPTQNITFSLIGTNLTNVYHPDALTRTMIAAPGRTFKLGVDFKF